MNYWLVKTEPDAYSWRKLAEDGTGMWDGLRNFQARNNLKKMRRGDLVLFYHSNVGLEVVGVAKVSKESYPDPTAKGGPWVAVDFEPVKPLDRPVPLKEIKKDPRLRNMILVSHSRLSVMPVAKDEFKTIVGLGAAAR